MIYFYSIAFMKHLFLSILLLTFLLPLRGQESESASYPIRPLDSLSYKIEMQASLSKNKTPLWLNANKYGLSSLDETNGYVRAAVERSTDNMENRRWGLGYGLDVAVATGYTSTAIIQQAYAELRWLRGTLTVGSKEMPLELKNSVLSSGSQTLGMNARPVPQVRLALADYWPLPFGNNWLHIKGHIAFGKTTDDKWQKDFTHQQSKYTEGALFHSKAGFLKIGNSDKFFPLSLEMGLEMATQFGGTMYTLQPDGSMLALKGERGIKAFWNAFWPGGSDVTETTYQNVEGNQLGSWMLRVNWESDSWVAGVYIDKYFEDHSSMFQLDYDGYGEGDEWQEKLKRRYLLYDFKDWMLGFDLHFKYDRWINDIVFEYLYSKYQSGPIYHDHTRTIADHIGGIDNYYNHYLYTGWQHWGMGIGNALYRSPIYNDDGQIMFKDNRFLAFHFGIAGHPNKHFNYRFMSSYQEGLGTYALPYTKKHHNVSLLLEAGWNFTHGFLRGFSIRGSAGADFGGILGNNQGFQLTIAKKGFLGKTD